MGSVWNASNTAKLVKLHNDGCTIGQMADALNLTEDQISSKLTRLRKDKKLKARDSVKKESNPVIAALSAQNTSMRRKLEAVKKRLGNWDLLAQEFAAQAGRVVVPKQPTLGFKPDKAEQHMVALLSDMHAGSRWRASLTDGYSEYDFETFCQRMAHYASVLVNIALSDRKKYGLKVLHVDSLGDTIQGILRVEDEVTNEFQIMPTVVNVTAVLFQWIVRLSEHFEKIIYTGKSGNHGRLTRKTEASRSLEVNFDTLINLQLRALVRAAGLEDRISVNVPDGQITTIERFGHRIRLMHGDTLGGGGGIAGIPLFSLARDMLRAMRKEVVSGSDGLDLIELGHFHTCNQMSQTILMNGCMCGPNPWAFNNLGAIEPATQLVYYTGEKHALGWSLPIQFDEAIPEHGFKYEQIEEMFSEDYYDFRTLYGAGSY